MPAPNPGPGLGPPSSAPGPPNSADPLAARRGASAAGAAGAAAGAAAAAAGAAAAAEGPGSPPPPLLTSLGSSGTTRGGFARSSSVPAWPPLLAGGAGSPRGGGVVLGGADGGGRIRLGVCAMARKALSAPMRAILERLASCHEFDVVLFGEESILHDHVESWPRVDCLLTWHAEGFPLRKAQAYVALRRPFCVNDPTGQELLLDRRRVYRLLQDNCIPVPRHIVVSRDGLPPGQSPPGFVESDDYVELGGVRISKPFVEKPASGEDHNINIYYPASMGGGVKRLFRKVADRSAAYDPAHGGAVRRSGSYIYEEFLATGGTDVKVYTVGPRYAHAEARKSPVVDGRVARAPDGKEVRFPVLLSPQEKEIARMVCLATGQKVCGFDLLRSERGGSYVCDVNGWSFVKGSSKFYHDAADILRSIILQALAPHRLHALPALPPAPTFGLMRESQAAMAAAEAAAEAAAAGGAGAASAAAAVGAAGADGLLRQDTFLPGLIATQAAAADGGCSSRASSAAVVVGAGGAFHGAEDAATAAAVAAAGLATGNGVAGGGLALPGEELRCVLAVVRHGDRTPKQKVKLVVAHPAFLALYGRHADRGKAPGPGRQAKLKSAAQLQELLNVTREVLAEAGQGEEAAAPAERAAAASAAGASSPDAPPAAAGGVVDAEGRSALSLVRSVLEAGGHFSGVNRKAQLKPRGWTATDPAAAAAAAAAGASGSSGGAGSTGGAGGAGTPAAPHPRARHGHAPAGQPTSLLLVVKWGGVLTHAGRAQAETLGVRFRTGMYPRAGPAGGGLLRLHSTYRHDFKVYSSDEGRVQTSAAAFTQGLLCLEGTSLTPILASLVNKDAAMLEAFGKGASAEMREAKDALYRMLTWDPAAGVSRCKPGGHAPLPPSPPPPHPGAAHAGAAAAGTPSPPPASPPPSPWEGATVRPLPEHPLQLLDTLRLQLGRLAEAVEAAAAAAEGTAAATPSPDAPAGGSSAAATEAAAASAAVTEATAAVEGAHARADPHATPPAAVSPPSHSTAAAAAAASPAAVQPRRAPYYSSLSMSPDDWQPVAGAPCSGERWALLADRWAKLRAALYSPKRGGTYDISKVPDIYDAAKHALIHNALLPLPAQQQQQQASHDGSPAASPPVALVGELVAPLYRSARALADAVVPHEYGLTDRSQLAIGSAIARELLGKLLADMGAMREESEATEGAAAAGAAASTPLPYGTGGTTPPPLSPSFSTLSVSSLSATNTPTATRASGSRTDSGGSGGGLGAARSIGSGFGAASTDIRGERSGAGGRPPPAAAGPPEQGIPGASSPSGAAGSPFMAAAAADPPLRSSPAKTPQSAAGAHASASAAKALAAAAAAGTACECDAMVTEFGSASLEDEGFLLHASGDPSGGLCQLALASSGSGGRRSGGGGCGGAAPGELGAPRSPPRGARLALAPPPPSHSRLWTVFEERGGGTGPAGGADAAAARPEGSTGAALPRMPAAAGESAASADVDAGPSADVGAEEAENGSGDVAGVEAEAQAAHRLCPTYATDINSPLRHVRTRVYVTSESHIHALLNVLRTAHLRTEAPPQQAQQRPDVAGAPDGPHELAHQAQGQAAGAPGPPPTASAHSSDGGGGGGSEEGSRSGGAAAHSSDGGGGGSSEEGSRSGGAAAAAAQPCSPLLGPVGGALLAAAPEYDYLTQIVFRMFENKLVPVGSPERFRVELSFSPGAARAALDARAAALLSLAEARRRGGEGGGGGGGGGGGLGAALGGDVAGSNGGGLGVDAAAALERDRHCLPLEPLVCLNAGPGAAQTLAELEALLSPLAAPRKMPHNTYALQVALRMPRGPLQHLAAAAASAPAGGVLAASRQPSAVLRGAPHGAPALLPALGALATALAAEAEANGTGGGGLPRGLASAASMPVSVRPAASSAAAADVAMSGAAAEDAAAAAGEQAGLAGKEGPAARCAAGTPPVSVEVAVALAAVVEAAAVDRRGE